ncbi:MAG: MBL fold metallo-hydrolase, partial [Solobacterium sp.]|nr:MBL fold metallo-hydrolase [Solobacterium sp.]
MKSFRTLSAVAAAALTMALLHVKAEDSVIVIPGQPAMMEAGMSAPIQEIVNLPDAVMTVSGENLVTDFDFGTAERTLFLEDNNYVTGYSYYNMMTLTGQVKQVKTALSQLPDVKAVVYRGTGESVPVSYIEDFNELLDKLNAFDHTLTLKYDFEKASANYIAENKSAKLEFHVQINGYWGYDLAGDSIIDKVTGQPGGFRENQELNNTYADFFFVDMTEKYEGMYELNDTDLQNPVLFMNDKEAMVIDVDFRGGQHLAEKITDIVGDRDLYIYITHAHGDHYNNLPYFDLDAVKGVYYGENERLEGNQILEPWDAAGKLIRYTDGMQFERAGKQFEVIEMDNHTPGGSQLLDITDRILFSGDTIGAQTFKGGTTVALSQLDNWIEEVDKSIEVLKLNTEERRIDYIIGGHTNHLNTWEFEMWVRQCLQEVKDKGYDAVTQNPIGQNTVVVKDGKVLTPEENLAEFLDGTPVPAISDEEVTHVASVNFRDDRPKTVEVTASGKEAMEAAGMKEAVQEIVNTPDAVMQVTENGSDIFTELNVGTADEPVTLDDNNYVTGYSYYNVMDLTAKVKQIKSVLDEYGNENTVIHCGEKVTTAAYINDLNELLDKLNAFDHTLSLKYDFTKAGSNYIAENRSAKLNFHVQNNGYWGYDLAGDS